MKHGKQGFFALLLGAMLLLNACGGTGAGEGAPGSDVLPGKMPPDKDALSAAAPESPGGEEEPESAAPGGGTQTDGSVFTLQVGGSCYQISYQLDLPGEIHVDGDDPSIIYGQVDGYHAYWDDMLKGKLSWTLELPEGAQELGDGVCVRSGLGFYDGSLDAQVLPAGVTFREWYYPIADGALYLCFRWVETDPETAEAVRATLRYSAEALTASPDGFAAYEGVLSPEDWETLSGFLPVLNGEAVFDWYRMDSDGNHLETRSVALEQFNTDYFSEAVERGDPETQLAAFTLCDIDGGDGKELALSFNSKGVGYYLILHREGESFYGCDFYGREFEELQKNGIYVGAGGAGTHYYNQLHFQNGSFERELLGYEDWGEYDIGGEAVDAETFARWVNELRVGDAEWFPIV